MSRTISQLEAGLSSLRALVAGETSIRYELGEQYNALLAAHAPGRGGFKTARAWLTATFPAVSPAIVTQASVVARHFTKETALAFSWDALRALVRFAKLKGIDLTTEPAEIELELPREDGTTLRKPFKSTSLAELRQAIRVIGMNGAQMPEEAAERGRRLEHIIRTQFGRLHRAKVRVETGTRFGPVIHLRSVPYELLEVLMDAFLELPRIPPAPLHPSVLALKRLAMGLPTALGPGPSLRA